jgi:ribosomal protein S27AE
MSPVTAWRTDEPCPVCATGLILHDDGTAAPRYECRLCGWSDTWTSGEPDGRDADHLGGGDM